MFVLFSGPLFRLKHYYFLRDMEDQDHGLVCTFLVILQKTWHTYSIRERRATNKMLAMKLKLSTQLPIP